MSFGKKDIVINISSEAHISKDISNKFISKFIDLIKKKSEHSIVKISNFGSFYSRYTPQRIGRNPKTNREYIISKRLKLFFKPSNKVKESIN
tara:strand:- start:2275 stop:2550 length:276 start_codon:yes stop_codon:yes gene_type:complete